MLKNKKIIKNKKYKSEKKSILKNQYKL